jgi:hypothetical protein
MNTTRNKEDDKKKVQLFYFRLQYFGPEPVPPKEEKGGEREGEGEGEMEGKEAGKREGES